MKPEEGKDDFLNAMYFLKNVVMGNVRLNELGCGVVCLYVCMSVCMVVFFVHALKTLLDKFKIASV